MNTSFRPLRLLQITDPHLQADVDGELLGIPTRESLRAVIAHARAHHPKPDAILATGDISQDGSEASYRFFAEQTASLGAPVYWIPGNHDQRAAMALVIDGTTAAQRQVRLGDWQLVMLDSLVEGEVHGHLPESELAYLDAALSADPERPAMVCLHHHPIDISAQWMNAIGLRNRDRLFETLARHSQVKALVFGHVHQALDQQEGALRLLATPSTCVQFAPDVSGFTVDSRAPGYRWLNLYPNGDIESGIERLCAGRFSANLNSGGY